MPSPTVTTDSDRSQEVSGTGVSVMAVTMWLWRLWKWLSRLFTGKSEIQRYAESKEPLEMRTLRIGIHTHAPQ